MADCLNQAMHKLASLSAASLRPKLLHGLMAAALSDSVACKVKETLINFLLAGRDALKVRPSAAKAACVAGSGGMAEAMPFQSSPVGRLNQSFLKS